MTSSEETTVVARFPKRQRTSDALERVRRAVNSLPTAFVAHNGLANSSCHVDISGPNDDGRYQLTLRVNLRQRGQRPQIWVAVVDPFATNPEQLEINGDVGYLTLSIPEDFDASAWSGRLDLRLTSTGPSQDEA